MSARAHRDAVIARLNSGPAGSAFAYSLGELDALAALPAQYTEVIVTERDLDPVIGRAGGPSDSRAFRVFIRSVADRENNAEEMRRRAAVNLIDSYLVVDGRETTIITRSASDDPIGPDAGWYSGTSEFSYSS